jgi:hypothetical protein
VKAKITFGIFILLLAVSLNTYSQATAYANIFATVIAPIGISNASEVSMGEIIITHKSATLSLNSGIDIMASGVKINQNGTATLATFSITDANNSTFDLTLPVEKMKLGTENSTAMVISNFSSTQNQTHTLNGIKREFTVGVNLYIPDSQNIKNLTAQNNFPVTLNYN